MSLSYLGASVHPPGGLTMPGDVLRFGSVSGMTFDAASGQWVAAMDDVFRPRLAWLDIIPAGSNLGIRPLRYLFLRAVPGVTPPDLLEALDMESLVNLPSGGFVTTNEGHLDRAGVPRQPGLIGIARDGSVTTVIRPRPHFIMPPVDRTRGVRHNLGLESLTRTPDGRLLSGLEQPLAQDGPVSSATAGGRVRLLEFVPAGDTWTPGSEWVYDLDPTPRQLGYGGPCIDGENGLSELYALDDHQLIALERACLNATTAGQPAFNRVRLHLVDLADAEDVSKHPSLAGVTVLARRANGCCSTWPGDDAGGSRPCARWSNFEGISAGPPASDGAPTIVLVSDDNFRDSQTFAFVWLKLLRSRWDCHQSVENGTAPRSKVARGAAALSCAPAVLRHVELVADAANGEQQLRLRRIVLQVAAQPDDEVVDGARVGVLVQVPHVLEDRLARHRLAGVLQQVAQQVASITVRWYGAVADAQLQRVEVERVAGERRARSAAPGVGAAAGEACARPAQPLLAPQQPAHPRQQDRQLERLRQVVVGAGLEAVQHVLGPAARGQHQDRDEVAGRAQRSAPPRSRRGRAA